jgi:hypothetical protein
MQAGAYDLVYNIRSKSRLRSTAQVRLENWICDEDTTCCCNTTTLGRRATGRRFSEQFRSAVEGIHPRWPIEYGGTC